MVRITLKKAEDYGGGKAENVLKVLAVLAIILSVLALLTKPTEQTTEYGVKVVSEISKDQLKAMKNIAMYNSTATSAELTCKFELSAISIPDNRGYRITIQEGDTGLYLKSREATIKGSTQEDILRACHVFACLRDGIECPNFMELDSFLRNAQSMSIILDKNVDQTGGRGYAEIVGALSYLQTKKVDVNGDGNITQAEVDANEFFIYPFIKDGDTCEPQPFNTMIQNWVRTNKTSKCSDIRPAIMVVSGNESAMRLVSDQLIISGDGDTIHTSSIILRDIIAPEWIRNIYGFR
jgi:hypothetical protein